MSWKYKGNHHVIPGKPKSKEAALKMPYNLVELWEDNNGLFDAYQQRYEPTNYYAGSSRIVYQKG